ncbi:MAG: hypothetical protein WA181_01005, partial [Bacillus mycoides]
MKYKEQEFTLELKENIKCMEKEIGYYSSVSIAVLDEEGEMIEFYIIPIWRCENAFLVMPTQSRVWGSKKVGELVDES